MIEITKPLSSGQSAKLYFHDDGMTELHLVQERPGWEPATFSLRGRTAVRELSEWLASEPKPKGPE